MMKPATGGAMVPVGMQGDLEGANENGRMRSASDELDAAQVVSW